VGYKLVEAVRRWVPAFNARARATGGRELNPTEIALLLLMAQGAHDDHAVPRYWGESPSGLLKGWKVMAIDLGFASEEELVPKEIDPRMQAPRKRVQRAVDGLLAAGAIERLNNGSNGSVVVYSLSYVNETPVSHNSETPVSHNGAEPRAFTASGTQTSHNSETPMSASETPVSHQWDTGVSPIETRETERETGEETGAEPQLAAIEFELTPPPTPRMG
jgi:hypothetical protein